MKQLTIRGVPETVAWRLEAMSRERGRSVNATVLEILEKALGVDSRRQALERYATWTSEDLAELQTTLAGQRLVDAKLWR